MASGYTYEIENDPNFTAKDFALTCARAFGTFFHQRDQPLSKRPQVAEMDPYPAKYLETTLKAKEVWLATSLEDKRGQWQRCMQSRREQHLERLNDFKVKSKRYAEMRAAVDAWQVPVELENLKRFMLEQIDESVRWGFKAEPSAPEQETFEEWLAPQEVWLDQDIEHAQVRVRTAQERHAEHVAYANALYEAVEKLEG
jgi:hypothetical protein